MEPPMVNSLVLKFPYQPTDRLLRVVGNQVAFPELAANSEGLHLALEVVKMTVTDSQKVSVGLYKPLYRLFVSTRVLLRSEV